MALAGFTFRPTVGPIDADRQYSFWQRATAGLPLAWSSSMANARSLAARAALHPGSRIYAERNGELVGYIGTHPPFDWGEIGLASPFGFPWTFPRDDALAAELYSRMLEAVPRVYAADPPQYLIQRFRSTWAEQLGFVKERGWSERFRKEIWARRSGDDGNPIAGKLRVLEPGHAGFAALSAHADHDKALTSRPSASTLSERAESGWFSPERCWCAEGLGAFSIDVRDDWAEVQLLHAHDGRLAELLSLLDVAARAHGANGVYFILGEGDKARVEQLRSAGFSMIDADVYVALKL